MLLWANPVLAYKHEPELAGIQVSMLRLGIAGDGYLKVKTGDRTSTDDLPAVYVRSFDF